MSNSYKNAVKAVDGQVGQLIAALKAEDMFDDSLILLTPDHGGKGTSHGGSSPEEMTTSWLAAGQGISSGRIPKEIVPKNMDMAAVALRALRYDIPDHFDAVVPDHVFEVKTTGITLLKDQLELNMDGTPARLTAAFEPFNATNRNLVWTSSDPTVAEVDEYGMVTPKRGGTAIITATTEDGRLASTAAVNVQGVASPELLDLKVNGTSIPGFVPSELVYTLNVKYNITVAEVTYEAADNNVTVKVEGGQDLQVGDNLVKVNVKAQNGKTTVYQITVIRAAEPEQPAEPDPVTPVVPSTPQVPSAPSKPAPPVEEAEPDKPGTKPIPVNPPLVEPKDIVGHWAQESINRAIDVGFVSGYPDKMFQPGKGITRAEFTVMLVRALKLQGPEASLSFTDAGKIGNWAKHEIAILVQAGIINGYSDGSFHPEKAISRTEMIAMIVRAMGLTPANSMTTFADQSKIPIGLQVQLRWQSNWA